MRSKYSTHTVHSVTGRMTDAILTQSAIEKSFDNLTIVIIAFKNLLNFFDDRQQQINS
jgi:hypothetical protein